MAMGVFMPLVSAAGAGPVQYEFTASAVNSGGGASLTFSSVNLGAAGSKHVLVGFAARASGSPDVTGVTIAGAAATSLFSDKRTLASGGQNIDFWIAEVSAASGNIVVTGSSSYARGGIGVWAIRNLKNAAIVDGDASGGTGTSYSVTIASEDDGAIFSMGYGAQTGIGNNRIGGGSKYSASPSETVVANRASSGSVITWTGVSQDFDDLIANQATSNSFHHFAAIALR